jgi:hypothetical protein
MERNGCTFSTMMKNAHRAGYDLVIVKDNIEEWLWKVIPVSTKESKFEPLPMVLI